MTHPCVRLCATPSAVVWLLVWSLTSSLSVTAYEELEVGETINGSVNISSPVSFSYRLGATPTKQVREISYKLGANWI